MDYWAAFSIGLVGGFHCIGMCGPIVMALPFGRKSLAGRVGSILLYNSGRTITYALLGVLFGLFGQGLAMAGLQRWVSIFLGVVMILSVITPVLFRKFRFIDKFYYSLTQRLKAMFAPLLRGQKTYSFFLIGLINGLLPCGLVYMALAGAIASGSITSGGVFMIFFGIGTIPLLFIFAFATGVVSLRIRNSVRKTIPAFIIILGIIFILRGSNLGIPYLSPKLGNNMNTSTPACCH